MKYTSHDIRTEIRAMIRLALPVVIAQVSHMSMGFVDTIMVGRLGSEALGAVGVGNVIYFGFAVFSFGVLAAVQPIIAHAYGAGDREEIGMAVGQGFWLALGLSILGIVVAWNTESILLIAKQKPEIAETAGAFVRAMSFGLPASFGFSVLRGFCDAINRTRVAMWIAGVGVIVNIVGDYALIYGKFGFPALGAPGAGYATAIVQWCMFAILVLYVFRSSHARRYRFLAWARRPRLEELRRIARIGLPIGATHSMEHGFFGVTSLMMGIIGSVALASHQVAIQLAALAFMVPLGIGSGITTRVGQAMGRGRPEAAALSGYVGIGLGTLFMCCSALTLVLLGRTVITVFTEEIAVLDYAAGLLLIAAAFQISDGVQVLALGALRGMKDTTRPMIINLIAYWLVGLPAAWVLAFVVDLGGHGLWWGLTIGLSAAAVMHLLRFRSLVNEQVLNPYGEEFTNDVQAEPAYATDE